MVKFMQFRVADKVANPILSFFHTEFITIRYNCYIIDTYMDIYGTQ